MQSKGFIKWVAIFLCLACLYELSFTWVTKSVEKDAVEYAESFVANDPACKGESVDALELELKKSKAETSYLDSLKKHNVVVYNLGLVKYTYQECKEKEINLGLDLKGGMNVMLEIQVQDVVKALAGDNQNDSLFVKALAKADKAIQEGEKDYIATLKNAYKEVSGGKQTLAEIFISPDRKDIQTGMSNDEVAKVLQAEADAAIAASYNVLSNRIDRFGVVQPNIQRIPNSSRILVELPGVKEPERVRKLLQGSASLEFWTTHSGKNGEELQKVLNGLMTADAIVAKAKKAEVAQNTEAKAEVAKTDEAPALAAEVAKNDENVEKSEAAAENSFKILNNTLDISARGGAIVGAADEADMNAIDEYLALPEVSAIIGNNVKFAWAVKADGNKDITLQDGSKVDNPHYGKFYLYALKVENSNGEAALDGAAIADARADYSQQGGSAEVSMTMNSNGITKWAQLTGANVGSCIAIVLDGRVYSAPNVRGKIEGGNSSITGDFTIQEAEDLANVLKSGKVPAPARIIQDTVVGPSLGQESINAGLLSFLLAFVLVLLYMVIFYSTAGAMSDVALIVNIFLLIGCVVSFGSVLTLPGIAGIVLTMGMAVDANVIIYERIKEELRGGKGVQAAIKDGFKNAYSAIIDGNLTTIITGIVLFLFGNGPVKGFATTLVVGILTSMFSAIFITRLLIDKWVEKRGNISFSFKWSENLLSNFKFDFIGKRFIAYAISGVIILAGVISLAVQGLNKGVEFTGGNAYVVRFDKSVSVDNIRTSLNDAFTKIGADAANSSVEVKQYGNESLNQVRIVTQYKPSAEANGAVEVEANDKIAVILYDALKGMFSYDITFEQFSGTDKDPNGIVSSEEIGPAIADDMTKGAIYSIIGALLAVGLYIILRFRKWQWAAGATIALIHDAFMIIAMFSLFYAVMPFNLEVNQAFIAAILTIIGYSINDTVVIFDRIREYIGLYPKRDLKTTLNDALSSTLMRTLNTSGTTLITLLAIFTFGGEAIRGFVFALIIGILVGTYSSVFIASPIAYDMQKK